MFFTRLSTVALAMAMTAACLPASGATTVPGYEGHGLRGQTSPGSENSSGGESSVGEPFMPFDMKPIFVDRPNVLTLEPIKLACSFVPHGDDIVLVFVNEGGPIPPDSEIHALKPATDMWLNSIKLPDGMKRGENMTIVLSAELWGAELEKFLGQACDTEVELA